MLHPEHLPSGADRSRGGPRFMPPEETSTEFSRRGLLTAAIGSAAVGGTAIAMSMTGADSADAAQASTSPVASHGRTREYWIQADSFERNLVPNGLDGMLGPTFTPDKTTHH